jgi:hypothetical protein
MPDIVHVAAGKSSNTGHIEVEGPVTTCHRMTAVPPSAISHTVLMNCKLMTIVNEWKWEQSLKHNKITTLEFNFIENHVLTQFLFSLLSGILVNWSNSFFIDLFGRFIVILSPMLSLHLLYSP